MSSLARVNRILEIFWWSMTVVTLILVLVLCFIEGFDKWQFFLAVPILTAILAVIRRFMSKRLGRSEAERAANSSK